MLRKGITFFLLLMLGYGLQAQGLILYGLTSSDPGAPNNVFEIVQVEPFSAVATPLYQIPNVFGVGLGSSTYDHDERRYIFWGSDNVGTNRFYAAAVDSQSYWNPIIQGRAPIELQYDLQDKVTYGLVWDNAVTTEYLVKVDLQTGQLYDSLPLAGVNAISIASSGINSNTHRYVFVGIDFSGNKRLYNVDALTGQILSEPVLPNDEFYRALQYDLNTNTLYGLLGKWDSTQSQTSGGFTQYKNDLFLVKVDTLTGGYTFVDSMPVLSGFNTAIQVGSIDFDQLSGTFIMVASDDTSGFRLMLINANTGQVYSNTLFTDLVYELECDNQIFARQAYTDNTTSVDLADKIAWQVYPNPTNGPLNVIMPDAQRMVGLRIFDQQGRNILTRLEENIPSSLNIGSLPSGLYQVVVETESGNILTKSILLQAN